MIATVPEQGDGEYKGWQTETYRSIATARVEYIEPIKETELGIYRIIVKSVLQTTYYSMFE